MISTWNIIKFSRCKVLLKKASNFKSNNTWNHYFSNNDLSIVFFGSDTGSDSGNYGTLKVVKKDIQNVLVNLRLTLLNFFIVYLLFYILFFIFYFLFFILKF